MDPSGFNKLPSIAELDQFLRTGNNPPPIVPATPPVQTFAQRRFTALNGNRNTDLPPMIPNDSHLGRYVTPADLMPELWSLCNPSTSRASTPPPNFLRMDVEPTTTTTTTTTSSQNVSGMDVEEREEDSYQSPTNTTTTTSYSDMDEDGEKEKGVEEQEIDSHQWARVVAPLLDSSGMNVDEGPEPLSYLPGSFVNPSPMPQRRSYMQLSSNPNGLLADLLFQKPKPAAPSVFNRSLSGMRPEQPVGQLHPQTHALRNAPVAQNRPASFVQRTAIELPPHNKINVLNSGEVGAIISSAPTKTELPTYYSFFGMDNAAEVKNGFLEQRLEHVTGNKAYTAVASYGQTHVRIYEGNKFVEGKDAIEIKLPEGYNTIQISSMCLSHSFLAVSFLDGSIFVYKLDSQDKEPKCISNEKYAAKLFTDEKSDAPNFISTDCKARTFAWGLKDGDFCKKSIATRFQTLIVSVGFDGDLIYFGDQYGRICCYDKKTLLRPLDHKLPQKNANNAVVGFFPLPDGVLAVCKNKVIYFEKQPGPPMQFVQSQASPLPLETTEEIATATKVGDNKLVISLSNGKVIIYELQQ